MIPAEAARQVARDLFRANIEELDRHIADAFEKFADLLDGRRKESAWEKGLCGECLNQKLRNGVCPPCGWPKDGWV